MNERYSYKDVIIDPEDPRVEIGAEYYYGWAPYSVVINANDDRSAMRLTRIRTDYGGPFVFGGVDYCCIIHKKKPERKWVPFDLSKPEVREDLRGRWIRKAGGKAETMIWGFWQNSCGDVIVNMKLSAKDLVKSWVFEDGSPCGEEVLE